MSNWYKLELKPELDLKTVISESREIAQALNEFANDLERIEKKYEKPHNYRNGRK